MAHLSQSKAGPKVPVLCLLCLLAQGAAAQIHSSELPEVFIANDAFSITAFGNQIVAPDGTLYVTGKNKIARYDANRGVLLDTLIAPLTQDAFLPLGMAVGADAKLYVSSREKVLRFDPDTGEFADEFIPEVPDLTAGTIGLLFGPDDNLYISNASTDEVLRYDGSTGAYLDTFVATGAGGLAAPQGMAFGPDGHLFVCSAGNDTVLKYDGTSGSFIDVFVQDDCGGDIYPRSIFFDTDAHLFITRPDGTDDTPANQVVRYDGITGEFLDVLIQTNAASDEENFSTLATGSNGPLYLRNGAKLQVHNPVSGELDRVFIDKPDAAYMIASRLAFGPDNNLYVLGNRWGNPEAGMYIKRYDGRTRAFIDNVVAENRSEGWFYDLTLDQAGNIYISNLRKDAIRKYTANGDFAGQFVTPQSGDLDSPTFLTFGPNSELYVAQSSKNGILRFDGESGEFLGTTTGQGRTSSGHNFAFGSNNTIFVSYGKDRIFRHEIFSSRFIDLFDQL